MNTQEYREVIQTIWSRMEDVDETLMQIGSVLKMGQIMCEDECAPGNREGNYAMNLFGLMSASVDNVRDIVDDLMQLALRASRSIEA